MFQVTNPSGWVLLSQSPAKCRVVEVSSDGVIVRRVPVGDLGLADGYDQPEPGKPNNTTFIPNCHVDDDPPHPTDPGVAGASGHHDTNVDVDHGSDFGAIVVQLMPFLDTPNPGGVYKAWMIPIERYAANGGDLEDVPGDKQQEIVKKKGVFQGYDNDPGFGPPRDQSKTDNFKVKEVPPMLHIFKFEDLDGDGVKDEGEPEITGWEVYYREVHNGEPHDWQVCNTPCWLKFASGTTIEVSEDLPEGWIVTYANLDGQNQGATTDVTVEFLPGDLEHTLEYGNFEKVEVKACKYEDVDGDGGKDTPIEGWTVHLTVDGEITETELTGADGCYTWSDLGPLPAGSYYDASETVPAGWTATSPTEVDFESPPQSGATYQADFTNFENVEVKACKLKDADGDPATTDDQTPKAGWPVYLTITGVRQETRETGPDGCYTWENLGPLPAGGYYDVGEDPQDGWIALGPTEHDFESPPQSGASYSFTFVNTPTQGCTPGFWQGGSDGGQAGGRWLWNTNGLFSDVISDPDWVASGGDGANPYNHLDEFCSFFGCGGNTEDMWHFVNPDMWEVNDDFHKAARSLTAAYLNASWGMAYAFSTAELVAMWADALAGGTLLDLHYELDAANNAPIGGCPIQASLP